MFAFKFQFYLDGAPCHLSLLTEVIVLAGSALTSLDGIVATLILHCVHELMCSKGILGVGRSVP